jgi:hypothetical protein
MTRRSWADRFALCVQSAKPQAQRYSPPTPSASSTPASAMPAPAVGSGPVNATGRGSLQWPRPIARRAAPGPDSASYPGALRAVARPGRRAIFGCVHHPWAVRCDTRPIGEHRLQVSFAKMTLRRKERGANGHNFVGRSVISVGQFRFAFAPRRNGVQASPRSNAQPRWNLQIESVFFAY